MQFATYSTLDRAISKPAWFTLWAPFVLCAALAAAQDATPAPHIPKPQGAQRAFVAASVFAAPGLACSLHDAADENAKGVTVYTDSDGYARFYALRATVNDRIRELSLDCTDVAGKASRYPVDLTADETFASRPLDIMNEPGIDRPALTGDPMSYSQAELLDAGYGLRPDPETSPDSYDRWLRAARIHGRILSANRPSPPRPPSAINARRSSTAMAPAADSPDGVTPAQTVYTSGSTNGAIWTGTIISGKTYYLAVEGYLSVPTVYVDADEDGNEEVHEAIWNGVGGTDGSGLVQGGYQIDAKGSALSYLSFREYCCGNAKSNNYGGAFNPKPGDTVISIEWYCDASGNIKLNGGYGCSFLEDIETGAIMSCNKANGSPCPSVPALPLCTVNPSTPNCETIGQSAESIIELQGPTWVPTSLVLLQGYAWSSQTGGYTQSVENDPVLTYDVDFMREHVTSHMNVSIGAPDHTYFSVSQFAQVSGAAHPGTGFESIAVGPGNTQSTVGLPWLLGSVANSNGDYQVYRWLSPPPPPPGGAPNYTGSWKLMPGAGVQIAIGPNGYPWLINHAGVLFYWNGSAWETASGYGGANSLCASHLAVGPRTSESYYGDIYTLGCHPNSNGDYNIYHWNGSWSQMPGAGVYIADGPDGYPWVVNNAGVLFYWNGSAWNTAPGYPGNCASAVAVGPNAFGTKYGNPWVLGCHEQIAGDYIYQLQGSSWVPISGYATQISVSPDLGVPWIVNSKGNIYQ